MAVLTGRVTLPANPNPMVKRVGLFDVSTGPLDLPVHARSGGIQYQTSICADPHCYAVTCIGNHTSKTLNDTLALITGDPFVIYSDLLCSPVGINESEVRNHLFTRLTMGEQLVVESVFSQQLCGEAPGLSNNSGITAIVTPATDPVDAVSQLEAALYATYGLPGVLHVPYRFAPYFSNMWIFDDRHQDNQVYHTTALGTKVNFGNYAGLSTSGANPTAGSMYIYITGQTTVWRTPDSELFVANIVDTLNRTHNQFTAVMEREYIVSFDCGGFAIECPITGVVA
jgi:hypothetical protein